MVHTQTFESSSSSAVHTAMFDDTTREGSCSCPAWRFKKGAGPRTCKHLRELETRFSATAAPVPAAPIATAPATIPVKPMLASAMTATAFADLCTEAFILEEKFDGHRVIIEKRGASVTAWSRPRSGKDALVRKLSAPIVAAVLELPDGMYDGEIDASLRTLPTPLVLFDICEVLGEKVTGKPLRERRAYLQVAVEHVQRHPNVISVPEWQAVTPDAVEAIWQRGGEGAIVKRVTSTYQPGKRSADWLKVKKAGSATLTITGFEAGKMGRYSVMQLRTDDGQDTTVKVLTNQLRDDIALNPDGYMGRRVVIAYCEKTTSGKFRHGVFDHFAGDGE